MKLFMKISVPLLMLVGFLVIILLPLSIQASDKESLSLKLSLAAVGGDVERARALISKGADVNFVQSYGSTPLLASILSGNAEMVKLLLEKGADPNLAAEGRGTPLDQAYRSGTKRPLEQFLRLLSENDQACSAFHYGSIPLGDLFDSRYITIMQLLIDYGADVNATSDKMSTLLMRVSLLGRPDMLKMLLQKGANASLTMRNGASALIWAAFRGNTEGVRLLRPHVNNMTIHVASLVGDLRVAQKLLDSGEDANLVNPCGQTPLMYAAWGGDSGVLKLLIDRGAVPNRRDREGRTALMDATWTDNLDAMTLLLNRGSDIDATDNQGRTALMQSASGGHLDAARVLLDRGADVNKKDLLGYTPLMCAVEMGHGDMARLLLSKGANVNVQTSDGWTAIRFSFVRHDMATAKILNEYGAQASLPIAALIGNIGEVERLLKAGRDINGTDGLGMTGLMVAASAGRTDLVKFLLEKGANVHAQDDYGWTALIWAARNGQTEILDLLLSKGADTKAETRNGWSALMWAAWAGHVDVVKRFMATCPKNAEDDLAIRRALEVAEQHPDVVRILEQYLNKPRKNKRKE